MNESNRDDLVGQVIKESDHSIVYKSRQIQTNSIVAIKKYYPKHLVVRTKAVSAVTLITTEQESQFLDALNQFVEQANYQKNCPYAPPALTSMTFSRKNHSAYCVMEYLSGSTLSALIMNRERPSIVSCWEMIFQAYRQSTSKSMLMQ